MPLSTTRSIFNATSFPDRHCGPSEPRRRQNGGRLSPLHKSDCRRSLSALDGVTVTRPLCEMTIDFDPKARADAMIWAFTDLMVEPMPNSGIFELYRMQAAELRAKRQQQKR